MLIQLDAKRAYLRKKYTSTKKPHFTEGWVEFKDKKVARSVAEMLNAQPIGGKKGSRWRDDVWTMKYLPRFKWNMLTEQVGRPVDHTRGLQVILTCIFFFFLCSARSAGAPGQVASRAVAVPGRAAGIPAKCRACESAGEAGCEKEGEGRGDAAGGASGEAAERRRQTEERVVVAAGDGPRKSILIIK